MNFKLNLGIDRLYGYRTDKLFVYIFLVAIFLFVIRLPFDSRIFGEIFQHDDYLDTGMDFFNSILCTQYGEPYERFKTLYPPLANLFYYFLYSCIPAEASNTWNIKFDNFWNLRASPLDLRVWQWGLVSFIMYIQVQTILGYTLIRKYLKTHNSLVSLSILFSIGMLFATERGNIIIYTMFLVLYFCFNYDTENKLNQRVALISLAVAVGLKIYPVVFSVLLLKKRMFSSFFATIILSLMAIFFPFIFFGGDKSIGIWFDVITGFGAGAKISTGTQYMSLVQFFATAIYSEYFPKEYEIYRNLILIIAKGINLFAVVVVGVYILLEKSMWKSLMAIGVLLVFGQQNSPIYNTIFLIPAMIMFFNENQDICKANIVYFIFLVFIMIPLPFWGHLKIAWVIRCLVMYSMVGVIINNFIMNLKNALVRSGRGEGWII